MKVVASFAIIALGVLLAAVAGLSTIGWLVVAIGVVALLASLVYMASTSEATTADTNPAEPDPLTQTRFMNKL